jgi:hypothetical protein
MNDERSKTGPSNKSLDERFASRPHVHARLQALADMMDKAIAEGATADEAEAMAIDQLRELGADVLTDWAQQKQGVSLQKARAENPEAINHIKKK